MNLIRSVSLNKNWICFFIEEPVIFEHSKVVEIKIPITMQIFMCLSIV